MWRRISNPKCYKYDWWGQTKTGDVENIQFSNKWQFSEAQFFKEIYVTMLQTSFMQCKNYTKPRKIKSTFPSHNYVPKFMKIISEISCIVHAQCPFWCLNNHRNQTQSQQTLQPTDSKMFSARIRPQLTIAQTWYAAVTPSASWITSVEWKQSCNFHNWLREGGNRLGVIIAYSKMFKTLESLELETHSVSFLKTDPQNSTQFSTQFNT
jgi:hypothetical protein